MPKDMEASPTMIKISAGNVNSNQAHVPLIVLIRFAATNSMAVPNKISIVKRYILIF